MTTIQFNTMETKEIKDVSISTLENNKLIAEFMGYPHYKIDFKGTVLNFENSKHNTYHKDWSWLMPVVEKIENIDFIVLIRQGHTSIVNNSGKKTFYSASDFVEKTKIEAVYNIVIEFIKWYNLNK